MKHVVTGLLFVAVFLPVVLQAQPVRNGEDVIWARDVAGATMTLDGNLTEPEWMSAETIDLVWNGAHAFPGSGQRVEGNPVPLDPPDPNNGTIYLLRDGNTLWLGAMVQDKSVGGNSGFFVSDGLIMNFLDRVRLVDERKDEFGEYTANFFQGNRTEFFYVWRVSGDTTDATTTYDDGSLIGSGLPNPGIGARFHGFYNGYPAGDTRDPRDAAAAAVWDAVTVVDGISNDDTHGDDVGYTFEMRIDLAALGYDFTQAGGDKMAWNVALMDHDYSWPVDADTNFRSRVWWQNLWGNNFITGVGYLHGAPGVTVSSGPVPEVTEPEFTVPNATLLGDPTIDGVLDETVWAAADPIFNIQYQGDQTVLGQNPEIAKYYVFYFKPNISGANPPPPVLDPSVARVSMIFNGNRLFVGVDVDDQAISGTQAEGGRDGIRLFFRDRDSLTTEGIMQTRVFEFQIDSSGVLTYGAEA
ncbi:MAG: hypothetical protein R3282_04170, partial [Rhodothermales bacterium]|nr:hypothetical protein [Rhodothermales bacterium]